MTAVSTRMDQLKPLLSGLRFVLIGALALLWPWLPSPWLRAGGDHEATRARWMALRWRVVGWLLVIELVIGQNLLGRITSLAVHPG